MDTKFGEWQSGGSFESLTTAIATLEAERSRVQSNADALALAIASMKAERLAILRKEKS